MKSKLTQLKKFLKKHPTLKAVKDKGRYYPPTPTYEIVCKICKKAVWLRANSYEAAEFKFDGRDGGYFYNRKLCIDTTDIDLCCECKDKTYQTPKDFEIQW